MIEAQEGVKTLNLNTIGLPYTIQLYGVTEEMFDGLVDEDTKAELIDGVMIMHSPASVEHDEISGFIRALMSFFADITQSGRVLGPDSIVHLRPGDKFAPDVFFIRQARVPTPRPKAFEGAPDLVVEVLSPSNRKDDLQDKRQIYRAVGVPEIWFVDKNYRQLIIDRKQEDSYVDETVTEGKAVSTVLEGFWMDVSWLWAEQLPNRMSCLREILSQTDEFLGEPKRADSQ
jgi:Uma2 family endonuclease